jgi:pyridinium-3,5-bisthiocarboxylic acid mononucleotide nickel chelatase
VSRLLYVDAVAGVAGDMLLGALLDVGAAEESVREAIRGVGVPGLDLELGTERRHGIAARSVRVTPGEPGAQRTWSDVRALIEGAALPARVRERALAVFATLADAEGRVHDLPAEAVRFHELGAADAIADVCGIAAALESLGIEEIVCSPLPVSRGFVDAAHGRLPLPAPATLELLRGAPLYGVELEVELVTPTGAAVVSALARDFGPLPAMRLDGIGYGAGARDLPALPNVVRVLTGVAVEGSGRARDVSLVETNLDDLSPELVPDAVQACFSSGALDVWVTPTQMKKGRPGIVLSALAPPSDEPRVCEAMLRESGTLGVRVSSVRRWELERESRTVEVAGREVRVKVGWLDGRAVRFAPEHDDCAAVAEATGQPASSVWSAALAAATREAEQA